MTAADEIPAAHPLNASSSVDLMSRYIALTAQLRDGDAGRRDLIATRAAVRDAIIDRIGLQAGMAFINDVERAARR